MRPLSLYLGVRHETAVERVACDGGLQATFSLPGYNNGTTVMSPRVSLEEAFWGHRLTNFGTSEVVEVVVETYCYRAGRVTGYIKASGFTRASSPDRSPAIVEVSSPLNQPPSARCGDEWTTLLESLEPAPCATFLF